MARQAGIEKEIEGVTAITARQHGRLGGDFVATKPEIPALALEGAADLFVDKAQ